MMSGAPNCQYPPWMDAEKEIVGRAWSLAEAWRGYRDCYVSYFSGLEPLGRLNASPPRTYKSIASEWYRQHPLLNTRLEPIWEAYFAVALDELGAMV